MRGHTAPRLQQFSYVGLYRYFLTICTYKRQRFFVDAAVVLPLLARLRECCSQQQFLLCVYCFMPDHVHAVVDARTDTSNLLTFVREWKKTTGSDVKKRLRFRLWQRSFYDHVLREDEDVAAACLYVLENPVRAGLVKDVLDYPFAGSDVTSVEDLLLRGVTLGRVRDSGRG